jgi:hypothetical protein
MGLALELLAEGQALLAVACVLDDPPERLARIRKGLSLTKLEQEQPLAGPRLRQTRPAALAVVDHMRRFVDDVVGKASVVGEVVRRRA